MVPSGNFVSTARGEKVRSECEAGQLRREKREEEIHEVVAGCRRERVRPGRLPLEKVGVKL